MAVMICSRHAATIKWLRDNWLDGVVLHNVVMDDIHVTMDDIGRLPADTIIVGNLPLHLAVAAIQRGLRYVTISLDIPSELRGTEVPITDDMIQLQELQLEWQRMGEAWRSDASECHTGVPEAMAGDCQQFRIGLVPRTPAELLGGSEPAGPAYLSVPRRRDCCAECGTDMAREVEWYCEVCSRLLCDACAQQHRSHDGCGRIRD